MSPAEGTGVWEESREWSNNEAGQNRMQEQKGAWKEGGYHRTKIVVLIIILKKKRKRDSGERVPRRHERAVSSPLIREDLEPASTADAAWNLCHILPFTPVN